MAKFIIGFGWASDVDIHEAPSLDAALQEARDRSSAVGVDAEGMDDAAWAVPYDVDKAMELGLLQFDEREVARQGWRALAPWR